MPNSLKKIIAVFIIIGMLPISYVSYELLNINETEEMLSQVYQRQLDAILFSVNQYSTDMVSSWANQLNQSLIMGNPSGSEEEARAIEPMFKNIHSLQAIYLSGQSGDPLLLNKDSTSNYSTNDFNRIVKENGTIVNRMVQYRKAGYQKMEVLDSVSLNGVVPILFAVDTTIQSYDICILVIDPVLLIESELGPKMQTIAGDQFDLSAFRINDDSLVYSTLNIKNEKIELEQPDESWLKKDIWLLPDFYLTISQKGKTIDQVVKERSKNNLIVLGIILFVSVVGMVFLFNNIRRELYLSNAKSEFVSNVSHEIRTPLSLISMFAETLEMGRVNKEEKKLEYYSIIKKETFRLTKIVNAILSFSKLDANKRTYQFEETDLNDLCKEILLSYSHHLADNKFNYDVDFTESISVVNADKEAISEAIINLIDNAVKYSDEKKEVLIATGQDKDEVFVSIKDFGMGIPKKYQKEIFDQFFRTPSNNVHNTKGSGLGLAIVKRIMMAHDGNVTVDSNPGEGSTFKLSFPTFKQT